LNIFFIKKHIELKYNITFTTFFYIFNTILLIMTKFLPFLIAFLAITISLNAQVIYFNDFSDGLGEMTAVDNDKRTVDSRVAAIGPSFSVANFNAARGNVASATSWFAPVGRADNWLITPKLKIEGENVVFSWKGFAQDAQFRDGYRVKVSTTDNELASFKDELLVVRMENAAWTERALDLSKYKDQEIYIAFQHDSDDMFILRLDDILVFNRYANDAAINTMTFDKRTCLINQPIQKVSFNVVNEGVQPITSFTAELTYKDETTIHQFSNLNISTGTSQNFTIDREFRFNQDVHLVSIEIVDVNDVEDDNTNNNTTQRIFESNEFLPEYSGTDTKGLQHSIHEDLNAGKVVVLDFFASWCGPCEFSTPALTRLYENNKDILKVYGITVEPTDTDAIVEALPWGATYPKFSYTPLNRSAYIHYASCLELNSGGGIPFFIMLCPSDLYESNITATQVGFNPQTTETTTFAKWAADAQVCQMTTSVDDIIAAIEGLRVKPNPASNYIELDIITESFIDVSIIDNLGRVVKNVSQSSNIIEINELPVGTYHLQAKTGDKTYQSRFIKQ